MKIEIINNSNRIPNQGEYFITPNSLNSVFIRVLDDDAKSIVKGWPFSINLSEHIICCEINSGCICFCNKKTPFTIVKSVNPIRFITQ